MRNLIFPKWVCFVWLFLGLFLADLQAKTPNIYQQTQLYSLERQWSVFEPSLGGYVPFLPSFHQEQNQIYLPLQIHKYAHFYLNMWGKKGDFLFVNNRLVYEFITNEWLSLNIDSLTQKEQGKPLMLVYHSPVKITEVPPVAIVIQKPDIVSESAILADQSIGVAKPRKLNTGSNSLVISSLVLLSVIAMASQLFRQMFSFRFIVGGLEHFLKGKNQVKRVSSLSFISFMVYHSLAWAYAIMFFGTHTPHIDYRWLTAPADSLWAWLGSLGVITLLVMGASVFKFFLISLLSNLYNDRQIENVHQQEYINLSQILSLLIAVLVILTNASVAHLSEWQTDTTFGLFLALMLAHPLLMSYRINNVVSYRKVYLFSYLCISEFIPLLLLAKAFLA